jgi:hypothetical protein
LKEIKVRIEVAGRRERRRKQLQVYKQELREFRAVLFRLTSALLDNGVETNYSLLFIKIEVNSYNISNRKLT